MANAENRSWRGTGVVAAFFLLALGRADAAWLEGGFPFRREVTINWEADKATGNEMAFATILANGKQREDGADVRVAQDDGKPVAFRLLGVGPGDQIRVVFPLARGQKRYHVYWGNPNPAPRAKNLEDPPITAGLLLEMKLLQGLPADTPQQVVAAFEKAPRRLGSTMIDHLFTGKNPFGDYGNWISRISGSIWVAADEDMTFAVTAKDRGLLLIDNRQTVWCPRLVHQAHFTQTVKLSKGRHDVLFYHANQGGEGLLTVAWKRVAAPNFDIIPREAFGKLLVASPGMLEENRKTLTADMKVEYMGEAFFAGRYSHRYRFSANLPRIGPPQYQWDFGDGQKADGNIVEHVFVMEGAYPVTVSAKLGPNGDSQTMRIAAARDFVNDKVKIDDVAVHSKVVEKYQLDALPQVQLPWVVLMHERANRVEPMLAAVARMAKLASGYDPVAGLAAINDATTQALESGQIGPMLKIWSSVPKNSAMHPSAARIYAHLLVWRAADFELACQVLKNQARADDRNVERLYAHALVLSNKPQEGRKILERLPLEGPKDREAAISGAMARTVEFYIQHGDAESGEEAWDKWQRQYPLDFLEGYSVLLRVRLIEARKMPEVAAKVAEAFALALPQSTYAPSLLDKASKLLEKSDPQKSSLLRTLLKTKYPENPLSQDKK